MHLLVTYSYIPGTYIYYLICDADASLYVRAYINGIKVLYAPKRLKYNYYIIFTFAILF